jgi:hypothetical protein
MYRKFDVTGNLLFAQHFFKEVNAALVLFGNYCRCNLLLPSISNVVPSLVESSTFFNL